MRRLPLGVTDVKAIADYARDGRFDLVVPGPESSLEVDLGGFCRGYGIPFAGPCRHGARFETSKAYAHQFCLEQRIPQPRGWIADIRQV